MWISFRLLFVEMPEIHSDTHSFEVKCFIRIWKRKPPSSFLYQSQMWNKEKKTWQKSNLVKDCATCKPHVISGARFFCWIELLAIQKIFVCTVGWAPWNLSCLEFKFDDTRLSYWHKNKIGRIEIFFVASWLC